ncbi:MAG: chemotaxis-specific protein-glutamate methyltransferase CheB [Thermoanaerobaculia bacterium]
MINVLVVEDSRVTRDYLVGIIDSDPALRVVGTVESGEAALEFLGSYRPDVVLMDIQLPGIDGFETTRRIVSSNPLPIVVCTSSTTFSEVHTAMHALEAGALAVMKKPAGIGDGNAEVESAAIISALKLMSEVKLVRRWKRSAPAAVDTAPASARTAPQGAAGFSADIVAIGGSTGAPPVVLKILSGLSPSFPVPILVVQHIATGFTPGFAEWLASASGMPVHVARDGELPLPGHVYVAPDDRHLRVGPEGRLETSFGEEVNGLRPSVGILFRSVAERFGRRAIGVLLTGMGRDGAEELKLMADRGALTIAQDEASSVVFGMPGEAVRLGAARFVFPPDRIAGLLLASVRRKVNEEDLNA